jgi:hypothetical protein
MEHGDLSRRWFICAWAGKWTGTPHARLAAGRNASQAIKHQARHTLSIHSPASLLLSTPCSSAATMKEASTGRTAPFIVIETDILSSGMESKRIFMSSTESTGTPAYKHGNRKEQLHQWRQDTLDTARQDAKKGRTAWPHTHDVTCV